MREIKFRAWDKINQQMVYNIQEMYDGYCDETDNGKYLYMSCFSCFLNDEQFAVMQYAGLKDKNGVEIYEGDVVRVVNAHYYAPYGIVTFSGKEYGIVDCWDEGFCDDFTWEDFEQYLEVVGNVYENPELLEEGE